MAKIIEGLYYSESHEFVKVEGEYAYIGITDFAQGQLGNVTYIEFPEIDDEISAGDSFGSVESVKAASDLTSPISGVVVEINDVLEDEPELINKDAYSNWLIKIKLSDPSELESLMDAQAYTNICK
nr:glycine cleavage system protein GcvH [uncultured Alloprevotella sp.]